MFGCKGGRLTNRCHSFGIILLTLCSVLLVEHIVEVAKLHEQKPMTSQSFWFVFFATSRCCAKTLVVFFKTTLYSMYLELLCHYIVQHRRDICCYQNVLSTHCQQAIQPTSAFHFPPRFTSTSCVMYFSHWLELQKQGHVVFYMGLINLESKCRQSGCQSIYNILSRYQNTWKAQA